MTKEKKGKRKKMKVRQILFRKKEKRAQIYILLGNNHFSNIFAKLISRKILFASTKPLPIANC